MAGVVRRGDDLHRQRDRFDQSGGVHVGPAARRRRRPGRRHRARAPLQHRPVADALQRGRSGDRVRPGPRRRPARSRLARRAARASAQARLLRSHLERARHDQPGRGDHPARSRSRRGRRDRRRPGGAAAAGRPARDRRRLLRLDRPQGLRPDRHRDPAWPARAARGDAAVHGRRPHDQDRRRHASRPGPICPGSSRPVPRRSPRRSGSERPSTGSRRSGSTRSGLTSGRSARTRWPRCARSRG